MPMALGTCQPGAVALIARLFGDCLYSARDIAGFTCGMLSICCWLVAQMPQLYRNYKNKSAEALSPWFLAEWLLGDTFNLLGALLQGDQPATVVFTAQYFIVVDMVMMVQYIYYISLQRRRERMLSARRHRHHHHHHHHHRQHQQPGSSGMQQHHRSSDGGSEGRVEREGRAPHSTSSGDGCEHANDAGPEIRISSGSGLADGAASNGSASAAATSSRQDVSFRPQRVLACLGALLIVTGLQREQQQPAAAAAAAGVQAHSPRRRLLMAAVDAISSSSSSSHRGWSLISHKPLWAHTVGTVLGYLSSIFYLSSRVSQIWKNYKRGSAEGLAVSMFVCAIAANTLYGSSILLRSYSWAELCSSLPWLIGSLGTVALDVTIYTQARMLHRAASQKLHPSDEDEPLLA